MSIAVTVTTEGGQQLVSLCEDLDERSAHMAPAFRDIALQIYAEEYMIFEAEGSYRGRPAWPRLSHDYAQQKSKATRDGETVGGSLKILQLSGRLRASLTNPQDRDAILQITDSGLYLGSKRLVEHHRKLKRKRRRWVEPDKVGESDTVVGRRYNLFGQETHLQVERTRSAKGTVYALGHLHATGAGHLPVRESLTVVDAQVAEWADKITEHLAGGTP